MASNKLYMIMENGKHNMIKAKVKGKYFLECK